MTKLADVDAGPPLLDTLSQIDIAWLEAALRAGGHDVRLRDFSIEAIGNGNVSDTARIRLDHDGGAPATVVAKFRPQAAALHEHGVASAAYRCEVGSYRLFARHADGCRTPRPLWVDGTDDNINIVMEDLSGSTRAGDQIAGCGIDDAEAVIVQLARLHRGFWPLAEEDAPDWLLRMPIVARYWAPIAEAGATQIARRFAGRLPDEHIAVATAAGPLSRAWHELRHSAMTVSHGDPRVDNILFSDGDGGPEAILIDWQVTGLRNAMHDVGYFLSGSLSVEDRRHHERTLLDRYADEFGGHRGYLMNQIVEDYRIQLVSGLMTTIAAVALLPDEPKANRLLLTLLERNCSAALDWETLDALRRRT